MKIAYGNYATPDMSPLESARFMADIGYEGVEFILHPIHQTMPAQWSSTMRSDVRTYLADQGMGIASIFLARPLLTDDPAEYTKTLDLLRETRALAGDVGMGDTPVLTADLGGRSADWPEGREGLLERLLEVADIATRDDFVLAVEPHYGGLLDCAERTLWLMDALDGNPRVRLLFDISHFQLAGDPVLDTVAAMVPHSAHVHIKEGRHLAEGYEFLATGSGTLDLPAYLTAMADAGWDGYLTLEVARMIWSRADYDAHAVAVASYAATTTAMQEAGLRA
jgi:sugar phosphate isomerase/epimerase